MLNGSEIIVSWSARHGQRFVLIFSTARSTFLSKIKPWSAWGISSLWCNSLEREPGKTHLTLMQGAWEWKQVECLVKGQAACFRVTEIMSRRTFWGLRIFYLGNRERKSEKRVLSLHFPLGPLVPYILWLAFLPTLGPYVRVLKLFTLRSSQRK